MRYILHANDWATESCASGNGVGRLGNGTAFIGRLHRWSTMKAADWNGFLIGQLTINDPLSVSWKCRTFEVSLLVPYLLQLFLIETFYGF